MVESTSKNGSGLVPTRPETPAVRCSGVAKNYGATQALSGIDVEVRPATVHALVGENGAGKSTLLGVLAGRVKPSAGSVHVFGEQEEFGNPRAAHARGIAAIYQELTIVPALSAKANVFLGQPLSRGGMLSEGAMRARFLRLCERLGVSIDPDVEARRLSVADQQLLEIMRALEVDARLILFDEPTAALAQPERVALFKLMRDLREDGVTMIFVSHNLDEVLDISDDVTVFRNGHLQASRPTPDWTKGRLVEAMLGEEVSDLFAHRRGSPTQDPAEILHAEGVTVPGAIEDVEITVHRGEIVGVAGLVGSGRTTLLRALAGLEPAATGSLRISGREVHWPRTSRRARALGVALVPEDRKTQGLVLGLSAMENIAMSGFGRVSRWGLVSRRRMRERAGEAAERFGFDRARLGEAAGNLSGGNQQKVLLARWGYQTPKVLLADEPTRGIDVGAKAEILDTLRRFADEGVGVVVVSSELEEVAAVADRVIVLSEGRRVRELRAGDGGVPVAEMLNAAFKVEENHDV